MKRISLCMLVLLAPCFGGCSFAFVNPPPTAHRQMPYFSCTETRTLPVVDGVLGAASLIGTVPNLMAWGGHSDPEHEAYLYAGILGGLIGIAFLASGWYGLKKVDECRNALGELMQRSGTSTPAPSDEPIR